MSDAEDVSPDSASKEFVVGLPSDRIDTARPASARIYNYLLGGKDNFPVDREAARLLLDELPTVRTAARENRKFMHRVVRYLAGEAGIRQFLDIGTGIPAAPNVHETAQAIAPESRVVYVDNDPIVLAHARALLNSHPDGEVGYLDADAREPKQIISSPLVRDVLDFSRPIGLLMISVLHFIEDDQQIADTVRTLTSALPAGSYLAASHVATDHEPEFEPMAERYRPLGLEGRLRSADTFEELVFAAPGLEILPPGVVPLPEWRRDPDEVVIPPAAEVFTYCGVARRV